jgi:hypothetical protein
MARQDFTTNSAFDMELRFNLTYFYFSARVDYSMFSNSGISAGINDMPENTLITFP